MIIKKKGGEISSSGVSYNSNSVEGFTDEMSQLSKNAPSNSLYKQQKVNFRRKTKENKMKKLCKVMKTAEKAPRCLA